MSRFKDQDMIEYINLNKKLMPGNKSTEPNPIILKSQKSQFRQL
jgi:hypothetical protein